MWKKRITSLVVTAILFLSAVILVSNETQSNPGIIYVDDDAPFGWYDDTHLKTIQEGIDKAIDGDIVQVNKGLYKGLGNKNLDFKGKKITVRSQDPDSSMCIRSTVIDGEGEDLIVRFINDEDPESIFEGFSLVPGNTSLALRGVQGFFEFSVNARPTTRNLRIEGGGSLEYIDKIFLSKDDPPYGGRLWAGNNPFHQPSNTTKYYGSGDVNGDGNITSADVTLAQNIVNDLYPPIIMADVDGDTDIDSTDASMINSALTGTILPAWWNNLTSRTARESWVSKVIDIDKTDEHPYTDWFVCWNFALQTFIHATFFRGDIFQSYFDGGQTVFNIPMYHVGVRAPGFAHSINAILVGDNPLCFDDWLFIEPQLDTWVYPGMFSMPYGSTIKIFIDVDFQCCTGSGWSHNIKVEFYVDETGWILQYYDPDLILTRPSVVAEIPDNRPDFWNPRIIPMEPNSMILFEQQRMDMSYTTDIHLANLSFDYPLSNLPLVQSMQYSRLLDAMQAPDGTIHLLWKGKPNYTLGIFHGVLNPITKKITNITSVATGNRSVYMGRIIITSGGDIHVFWLDFSHRFDEYDSGIYWSRWTGNSWEPAQNIVPNTAYWWDIQDWDTRDFLRYLFDVVVLENDEIVLVYVDPIIDFPFADVNISYRHYDGMWEPPATIENTYPSGVEIITDFIGNIHLVYWTKQGSAYNVRGNLFHRVSADGYYWSDPEMIDSSGNACCPSIAAGTDGNIFLVWERNISGHVIPILRTYNDGYWGPEQQLNVPVNSEAWYPTVAFLPEGKPVAIWSSRSNDRVTIEYEFFNIWFELDNGWNLFTFPFENDWTAETAGENISDCTVVIMYNASTQSFFTHVVGTPHDNFPIEDGMGYFIYCNHDSLFSMRDLPIKSVNISIHKDWNLIGWYNKTSTTAESLGQTINGTTVVIMFNSTSQTFLTHVAGTPHDNFTIERGKGLFIYTYKSSVWHGEG